MFFLICLPLSMCYNCGDDDEDDRNRMVAHRRAVQIRQQHEARQRAYLAAVQLEQARQRQLNANQSAAGTIPQSQQTLRPGPAPGNQQNVRPGPVPQNQQHVRPKPVPQNQQYVRPRPVPQNQQNVRSRPVSQANGQIVVVPRPVVMIEGQQNVPLQHQPNICPIMVVGSAGNALTPQQQVQADLRMMEKSNEAAKRDRELSEFEAATRVPSPEPERKPHMVERIRRIRPSNPYTQFENEDDEDGMPPTYDQAMSSTGPNMNSHPQ